VAEDNSQKTSMLQVSEYWDKCINVGGGYVKK
jgi:hypothetical protein